MSSEYVTNILQFILMLCTSLINKLVTSVDLEVMTIDQGMCVHNSLSYKINVCGVFHQKIQLLHFMFVAFG